MKQRYYEILENFKGARVLIVGDVMLDYYYWGDVDRISPEAPVPVVQVKKENHVPGGAANTANNISSLSGVVLVAGIVGNDNAGKQLISELSKKGIITDGIIKTDKRPTTQKVRVIGNRQQLARIDYEETDCVDVEIQKKILGYVTKNIPNVDAIVFSDYAKGLITRNLVNKIIKLARQSNKPTIADVKPKHISFFKGVTIITPNKKEASEMAKMVIKSEDDLIRIGEKLVKEINTNVLITRGQEGMTLFERDGSIKNIPTKALKVFDVTGAGDTVVAGLSLALAAGASYAEATVIANYAAGIVVGIPGTSTTTIDNIKEAIRLNK